MRGSHSNQWVSVKTCSVVSFFSAMAFASSLAAQSGSNASLTVGTATAKRGERAYGALIVPAGVDSGTTIQVAVINGAKPGRIVAFISGAHGTEYTSVVALTKLIDRIDPKKLTGSVIIVPLLNVASFEQMVPHINPVDRKGMNASYPGNPSGTQTERALAMVAEQVVKPADVVVDLHGGDLDEDLRPYSYWMRSGNAAQDSASRVLDMAFGLDMVIVSDVDVTNPARTRSLSGYSLVLGKTTFVAEAGRSGLVTAEETGMLVSGSLNVLASLKMIDRVVPPAPKISWVGHDQRVRADSGGMFYATAARGSRVIKGSKIGYITDYVGRKTSDVLAPQSGVVSFIRGVPSLAKGSTIVTIVEVFDGAPPPWSKPAP
jgi:predicted deacylase